LYGELKDLFDGEIRWNTFFILYLSIHFFMWH
jgi:hypothetical protein